MLSRDVAEVGGTEQHDIGLVQRDGGARVGEEGVLGTKIGRRAGDKEALRIIVAVRQFGIIKQRIGIVV